MCAERAATQTVLPVRLNVKPRAHTVRRIVSSTRREKSAHGTIALSDVIYLMSLIAYCAIRAVTLTRQFEYVKHEDADAALTAAAVNTERYVMYGEHFE